MDILLQQNDLINTGLQISPYNAAAFGALVVVLAIAVIFLWRADTEKSKKILEVLEKTISISEKVDNQLSRNNDLTEDNNKVLQDVKYELASIKERLK